MSFVIYGSILGTADSSGSPMKTLKTRKAAPKSPGKSLKSKYTMEDALQPIPMFSSLEDD